MRPKFVQARRTTLAVGIAANETGEIKLKNLVDIGGNALSLSDFGATLYLTINPGSENEEIISATDFTVNSDGTVSIDTGITRGLNPVSDYAAGGTANAHSPGTVVVVSNNPQIYEAILDYIDGISLAAVSNASITSAGISEEATTAEIDADTGVGATTRRLFVNPERLSTSKYATRLPSTDQKTMLNAVTGMIFDYVGDSAPTGFLLCDGSSVDNDTHDTLATVIKGKYGVDNATTFTADSGTNVYTANAHGLSDGDIVFVASSAADLPDGLSPQTPYYVISATTNTFKLSTTSGGSEVAISDNGTGTHSFYTQFKVPDLRGSTAIGSGQKTITFTFTDSDVDTGTEEITVESNDWLHNGQAVALTTTGVLPTGLSATTYYVIRVDATTIKLATSIANANAGTAVNITAASGGGTHTLTLTLTDRTLGDNGGEETTQMSDDQMPSHVHTGVRVTGTGGGSGGSSHESGSTAAAGGDEAQNNMSPYVVVTKIIKT